MVSINDQRELAKEIADTISQPFGMPFEEVSVRVFFFHRARTLVKFGTVGRYSTRIGRTGTRDVKRKTRGSGPCSNTRSIRGSEDYYWYVSV